MGFNLGFKGLITLAGYVIVQPRFESELTSKTYHCTNPTGAHGDDSKISQHTGYSFTKTQDTINAKDCPHVFALFSQAIRIPADFCFLFPCQELTSSSASNLPDTLN